MSSIREPSPSPVPSPIPEDRDAESSIAAGSTPTKGEATGKIIDWSVEKLKLRRKGPWMPTELYIMRIAAETAAHAAKAQPLDELYRQVVNEYYEERERSRPVLDDRKLFFYEMVICYIEELIVMDEEEDVLRDVEMKDTEGDSSSVYSSSSDSQVSEIDWEMIQAVATASEPEA